ncbi:hypothetical protein [Enterococcus sp. HY326]|uniref:hypothetical protein n=1 Tax=Enterococcus sp. HY326 TaxID=2971265 RepID=UPI002240C31F|nr:hypothetical protein [Enterococcus sp. HY326]
MQCVLYLGQLGLPSARLLLLLAGAVLLLLAGVVYFTKAEFLVRIINVPIGAGQKDTQLIKRRQLAAITCLVLGLVFIVAGITS